MKPHNQKTTVEAPPSAAPGRKAKKSAAAVKVHNLVSPTLIRPISKFSMGDHATHQQFGVGVVTSINNDKIEVDFKDIGSKWILDSYLKSHN